MGKDLNRRDFLQNSAVGAGAGVAAFALPAGVAGAEPDKPGRLRVERTTVEYADTLLGTDETGPRLSWVLAADGHGARQSAYQIQVTTDARRPGAVWDSGRVRSARSVNVEYSGPGLRPRTRYHWRVRVWDGDGHPSPWSAMRWWETALLGTSWQARWIGPPAQEAPPEFGEAAWIWSPDSTTTDAPAGPRWFRTSLELPDGGAVVSAHVVATGDDDFTLFLDGRQVLHAPERVDGWRIGHLAEVTELVRAAGGRLVLAARATNRGDAAVNPGGLLVRLVVTLSDGGVRELVTGPGWWVSDTEQDGWQEPRFDHSGWAEAVVLAAYGEGPWGTDVTVAVPERPAPLLRREFALPKPVARARLYISGLAYYDAELNGERVGTQVLDPGFTDYDRTVLYTTHDVTELLHQGGNAIGVTLGRGFYSMTTQTPWNWHRSSWHAEPQLLAQLEIEHTDGSRTIVGSNERWRMTDGPTLTNSQYAGETYDARRESRGWTEPGFDDNTWSTPVERDAPAGVVRAQQHEPIEVIESVRPTDVTELRPGVYIVDMGRTMAGWTRLSVAAPAGTRIELVHGERLADDGSVRAENGLVPGRFQRDEYICSGRGTEKWEPRFSYKGFRYVQVSGLPSAPKAGDVLGRLVHSAVPEVSSFRCSEPFYERLDQAMRRTVRNNLHGIPTDTPMYEKNGWTGDVQVGLPTMVYAFGMGRFLTKWAGDLADSQNEPGQLPVIVPSGGWGYAELAPSPEWTTVYPFLLREMYRVYEDERIVAQHWEPLVRYLDWEIKRLRDGLAVTALGDYLPPGYGGIPPEDTRLTATAYLYRALSGTAELGTVLGHEDVADRYRAVAADLRTALNAAFLGPDGYYRTAKDPGYRQTSNAIPLAFGLVPPGTEASVVASLVADIRERGNHLNTGCLGTSVLLRVLSAHGHADVAHALATQRDYPSWGYWFDNGADTMWEMWNLDSRSRDHYFQGTVAQWLYENVAGLRPGDAGYESFVVRPDARAGVAWARTSIDTVRGEVAVGWSRIDDGLRLTVRVPVGSTAEVYVPAASEEDVTSTPAAEVVRTEPGFVVVRVGQGEWSLRTRSTTDR